MKSAVGLCACALALVVSSAGHAADESTSPALEEIIVTATKRSENLQNMPVAIQALTQTELTKQGVFESTDLNHFVPNFQVSSASDQQQPNFTIRGIGVDTKFNANAASPVGVYVDEV
jgi:iron complex outermembrane receptor protein